MYICDFSRSVGAGSAITRKTRGLTRSVSALMVPPLPAPSRPSKAMQTLRPFACTQACSSTSSTCSLSSLAAYSLPPRFSSLPAFAPFALPASTPCFFAFLPFMAAPLFLRGELLHALADGLVVDLGLPVDGVLAMGD